ncbi:hypothetical protein E1B28_007202 [Marasmius oreades]|uniref:Chromo domain-containing protein n=1 Tax=Marasmius oreades TaxID=181124 RepID=A0A9P7UTS9_9AGAR|nr:uncharacterized protein E1B28_007202 [Marasmius oreades]KAG7093530.1 hypothetical protein E1B28_007202 [Marasmius oreades]
MAAASVVSDSDAPERSSAKEKNQKGKEKNEESEGGEEEEAVEEYEIEAILAHKRVGKKIKYHIKWKGYEGPDATTWEPEEATDNAKELIEEYWRKYKSGRKSTENGSVSRKGRKSTAAESPAISTTRKRSRNAEDSSDEKELAAKRHKETRAGTSSVEPDENESTGTKIVDGEYMKKYTSLSSWEQLVAEIDTVERDAKDSSKLSVYFRLTKKAGGERVRLGSSTCNQKFPQKMIKFYEKNLRWKETEVEEEA